MTTTVAQATFDAQARLIAAAAIRAEAAVWNARTAIETESSWNYDVVVNVTKLAEALEALATEVETA